MRQMMTLADLPEDDDLANTVRNASQAHAVPGNWHLVVNKIITRQAYQLHDSECKRLSSMRLFHQLHPLPRLASWLQCSSTGHPGVLVRIKLRANDAHLMDRVGARCKPPFPPLLRQCLFCNSGEVEDVAHFAASCPFFGHWRSQCSAKLRDIVVTSRLPQLSKHGLLQGLDTHDGLVSALLGGPLLSPLDKPSRTKAESVINTFFKHAWQCRERIWATVTVKDQRWRLRGL